MNALLQKYAQLLVCYCLQVQPGEQVYIKSTTLAEELLKYVHDEVLLAGGLPYFSLEIANTADSFYNLSNKEQLSHINALEEVALKHFDCYLVIRAPFNLRAIQHCDQEKINVYNQARQGLNAIYFERTGNGSLKRCLCQFPTNASAQEAGMSLNDYENFVYKACGLFEDNAIEYWQNIGKKQQKIVDYLNTKQDIRFVGPDTDIQFSTAGRTWINSDGKNNMPSGEVFTAPVENSVNGHIHFSYPTIYRGQEVENIRLTVSNGYIESWSASKGQEILDTIFKIEGTRHFGEAAIGTNYNIQRITKNILFDEKIGGSIHMAIGQSYKQCGGKNESTIHWDMITDMKKGGQIYADDELFYEDGQIIKGL